MKRFVSLLLFAGALALIAVAVIPRPRVHAFLDARAGHVVTEDYVDAVRMRAALCGVMMALIAVAAPFLRWGGRAVVVRPMAWSAHSSAVIAIGAIVRALLLPGPPHYDEAFTVTEFASRSPLFFLTRYTHPNNHVLHTILVWLVHLVSGNRLWALRLPALLAGIAVLFATYALARSVAGERTALLAAALAAGATPLVEYSAQARGYTILTLLFLLLYLSDDDRVRGMLIALAAWTIPTALYAAAAWAAWMLVTQRAWRRVTTTAVIAAALAFLLYVPILVVSGPRSVVANGNVLSVSYSALAHDLPRSLAETWRGWNLSFGLLAIVPAVAALLAMIRRTPAGMLLSTALLAIVPLLIAMRKVPFPRTWIFVVPIYVIAAASELARLKGTSLAAIVIALLLGANAVRVTQRHDFVEDPALRDVPAVAAAIRALPPDARVLVTSPLDAPFTLYANGRIVEDRFDSHPQAVRSAMAAAPRRYFVASTRPGGMTMLDDLRLPYAAVPVARFPHSMLFELR